MVRYLKHERNLEAQLERYAHVFSKRANFKKAMNQWAFAITDIDGNILATALSWDTVDSPRFVEFINVWERTIGLDMLTPWVIRKAIIGRRNPQMKVEESANPTHYSSLEVSPIDGMNAIGIATSFCKGSALKHLMRDKDGPVDLLKAVWYCVYLYARAVGNNHQVAKERAILLSKQLEEDCARFSAS